MKFYPINSPNMEEYQNFIKKVEEDIINAFAIPEKFIKPKRIYKIPNSSQT